MPISESSTSSGLLELARTGNSQSWQCLRDRYHRLIVYWCRNLGLKQADAEDLCQEVFIVLSQKLPEFRGDSKFRTWLRVITYNKCRDFLRRARCQPRMAGDSTAARELANLSLAEISDESVEREANFLLTQVIYELRESSAPNTWLAFWKTTIDQLSANEVADELEISVAAVRQAKYRILKRIRERLEQLEFELD